MTASQIPRLGRSDLQVALDELAEEYPSLEDTVVALEHYASIFRDVDIENIRRLLETATPAESMSEDEATVEGVRNFRVIRLLVRAKEAAKKVTDGLSADRDPKGVLKPMQARQNALQVQSGQPIVTAGGYKSSPYMETNISSAGGQESKDLHDWLRANGGGDIVKTIANAQSLASYVREWVGGQLEKPKEKVTLSDIEQYPELAKLLNLSQRPAIQMNKVAAK